MHTIDTKHCNGYMTTYKHTNNNDIFETHWAVLHNGTILASCDIHSPTNHFGKHRNGKPAHWTQADELPKEATFIGRYPAPKVQQ